MTAHNRIAPITHRPIAQGLRCASIAHPRLEIDLVDLKPPAVTACLHHDVDEHAKESANIVAGEIAAAFRFQIGRASCRARVGQYVSISVVAVSFKKKTPTNLSILDVLLLSLIIYYTRIFIH